MGNSCISARKILADSHILRSQSVSSLPESVKTGFRQHRLGSMNLSSTPTTVLLIFAHRDSCCKALITACEKVGMDCSVAYSAEQAASTFHEIRPSLVFIDHRHPKQLNALAISSSLNGQGKEAADSSVFIACIKRQSLLRYENDKPFMQFISESGFSRFAIESHKAGVWVNELLQLERNDLTARTKLNAAQALLLALDRVTDAVNITDSQNQVQYVNSAFEKLIGYRSGEILGRNFRDLTQSEKNPTEISNCIQARLKDGKSWEGCLYTRRKSGSNIRHYCCVIPTGSTTSDLPGPLGHIVSVHLINVDSTVPNNSLPRRSSSGENSGARKSSGGISGVAGGGPSSSGRVNSSPMLSSRRGVVHFTGSAEYVGRNYSIESSSSSLTRSPGMKRRVSSWRESLPHVAVEAPIAKATSLLSGALQSAPKELIPTLESVMDILRSSELYTPAGFISKQMSGEEDSFTGDLVGGLITNKPVHSHLHPAGRKMSTIPGSIMPSVITGEVMNSDRIRKLLEHDIDWKFNMIEFELVTAKKPLVHLGWQLFKRFDVSSFLKVNDSVIVGWLEMISHHYHSDNPYHNATHAADVMQCTGYLLMQEPIKSGLQESDAVACLVAAVVHDIDHPGRTNPFLVNSGHELACLYNDRSVLESHHAALSFKLTAASSKVNIFSELSRDDYREVRESVIDMVLSTEMARHFDILNKFKATITSKIVADQTVATMNESQKSTPLIQIDPVGPSPFTVDFQDNEVLSLIKRLMIKISDVNNPARPRKMCIEWAKRISQEYLAQTDEEKEKGLPVVMPMFERKTFRLPNTQVAFIELFLVEMFDIFNAFCDISELIDSLDNNYIYWKRMVEQEKEAAAEIERHEVTPIQEQSGEDISLLGGEADAESVTVDARDLTKFGVSFSTDDTEETNT